MCTRSSILLAALLSLAAGCNDDPAFLPLPKLCEERSQAICSARASSCEFEEGEEEDDATCQSRVLELCNAESAPYLDEPQLTYDSVIAIKVREEEQAALDAGDAPFPIARFFVGGFAIGDDCERDSQCETGLCDQDTQQCVESPETTLCDPA